MAIFGPQGPKFEGPRSILAVLVILGHFWVQAPVPTQTAQGSEQDFPTKRARADGPSLDPSRTVPDPTKNPAFGHFWAKSVKIVQASSSNYLKSGAMVEDSPRIHPEIDLKLVKSYISTKILTGLSQTLIESAIKMSLGLQNPPGRCHQASQNCKNCRR